LASAAVLYTPELLALATGLADFPLEDRLPLRGAARSRSCGSTLELGLAIDAAGRIERLGMKAAACAVGQAAAAIFAAEASGRSGSEIAAARAALERWLAGEGPMPAWPGIEVLAPALPYPARHGAILLAWNAASDLLPMA